MEAIKKLWLLWQDSGSCCTSRELPKFIKTNQRGTSSEEKNFHASGQDLSKHEFFKPFFFVFQMRLRSFNYPGFSSFWVLSSWDSSKPWGKPLFRAGGSGSLQEEEGALLWACPTMLQWNFTHPGCKMVLNELLGPNMGSSSYKCTGRKELEAWVLDTTIDLGIFSYLYYTRAYIPFLGSYLKWLMLFMSHAVQFIHCPRL